MAERREQSGQSRPGGVLGGDAGQRPPLQVGFVGDGVLELLVLLHVVADELERLRNWAFKGPGTEVVK